MRPIAAFECELCRRLYRVDDSATRCELSCKEKRESVLGRSLESWEDDIRKLSPVDQARARARLAYESVVERGIQIVSDNDG